MKSFKNIFFLKALLAVVILFTIPTSCNKWIDIEPENDLIQQEFWKTRGDVMSVVAATYNAVRDNSIESFGNGEIRADFITLESGTEGLNAIAGYKITPTTGGTDWGDYYDVINLANTVMFYAPQVQGEDQTLTDELLDQIDSEMIFLRSLSYFYLVRIWKEVPLILRATVSDTVNFYKPKSPEHVIINQLIKDLNYASTLATTDDLPQYRANKYAILALLADVYLWNEDYDNCLATCDAIINSGRFALESNENWFNLYYPGNSPLESIFEIQYDDQLEAQSSPMDVVSDFDVYLGKMAYERLIDIRYCGGKGPGWKYFGKDETGKSSQQRRSGERDANYIYYRYSEILLMKAECLAEKGNFEDANNLVSIVKERAGTIHDDKYTISSFRESILAERGREFAAEGKRWFELLRFAKRNQFEDQQLLIDVLLNKAEDAQDLAIMRSKVLDTMSFYLPINDSEIRLNRNLVQNPFYDK